MNVFRIELTSNHLSYHLLYLKVKFNVKQCVMLQLIYPHPTLTRYSTYL